jgi:hypothetical protein
MDFSNQLLVCLFVPFQVPCKTVVITLQLSVLIMQYLELTSNNHFLLLALFCCFFARTHLPTQGLGVKGKPFHLIKKNKTYE